MPNEVILDLHSRGFQSYYYYQTSHGKFKSYIDVDANTSMIYACSLGRYETRENYKEIIYDTTRTRL